MSNLIKVVTPENFNHIVLNSKQPVLLDFWAEWCGPCKIFLPILEDIAQEYHDKVIVSKVNVDHFEELGVRFSITSIPTLLFFKEKEIILQKTGVISKNEIKKLISTHFNIQ